MRFETITMQGPPGEQGPQGPEGPAGDQGPQGEAGLGLPTGVGEVGQFVKLMAISPDVAEWQNIGIDDVTDLQTTLNGKAATSHTHLQSDVTNLVTDLAGKASAVHTHVWSTDITGKPTTLAGYGITDAAPLSHVGTGGTAHANVVAAGAAGFMTGSDKTKLDGIDYTAADILTKLKTVDGAGSLLDADLLDGKNIGTSGNAVPLLDGFNIWTGSGTLNTSSTTGQAWRQTVAGGVAAWCFNNAASAATANTVRLDFTAVGGVENFRSAYIEARNAAGANGHTLSFGTNSTGGSALERGYVTLGWVLGQTGGTAGVTVASGGDKGIGTLNAVGVYDDNVLLTCPALQPEFIQYGDIDLAKWDALSPTGEHKPARHFHDLVAGGFDPRDPVAYVQSMLDRAALPGMPSMQDWQHGDLSTGEMISRLWLALDMLALAWMSDRAARLQPPA